MTKNYIFLQAKPKLTLALAQCKNLPSVDIPMNTPSYFFEKSTEAGISADVNNFKNIRTVLIP